MKVLVTGVGGFIGAHVARRFANAGYDVVGVDDFSSGHRKNVPQGIDLVVGDLAETITIDALPRGCKLILHLAGQSSGEVSFDDPIQDLRKNTVSTLNLIHYGVDNKASRFVYASSMSVYGNVPDAPVDELTPCRPLSCYGVGKLATENYLRVYSGQLPFVALRMFNVYGPGQDMSNLRQGMVSIFLAQALTGGKVHVKGSLDRYRDFIYIDDVVEAWYRAATFSESVNQVINLGTGTRTTVGQLLEAIHTHIPEITWHDHGCTPGDQHGVYSDPGTLARILSIESFIPLETGVRNFIKWAIENIRHDSNRKTTYKN